MPTSNIDKNIKVDISELTSPNDLKRDPVTKSKIRTQQHGDQHRRGVAASQFHTSCQTEHEASLECIYDNYHQRERCAVFFERYKACKREEHNRILEARKNKSIS
mmetsp:Transcript_12060/g.17467  ORF Transcript_12060/g.17467 Transcript_12060/m.17467 type:complete len:105 (-) Transcript_12060:963-1277(-)